MSSQPRQPKGQPVGGQFAGKQQSDDELDPLGVLKFVPEKKIKGGAVNSRVARLKTELEDAILSLDSDIEWAGALERMQAFHNYSFGNTLLIWAQRPTASRCAGVKTWNTLGRQVKKGERGLTILAPKFLHTETTDDDGKKVVGEDGKPVISKQMVGFTTRATFDVSQTEGDPLPGSKRPLSEVPPPGFVDDLTELTNQHGFEIEYRDLGDPYLGGYTSPHEKKVVINTAHDGANQAKTLAHELGHIEMGHLDRIEEYHTGSDGCRGQMEVEAESFAFIVSRENGMSRDLSTNSSRYLNGWAAGGKVDETSRVATVAAMRASGDAISKATRRVLQSGAFRNTSR